MISAIITTLNDERRLGGAMACLVPAAMDAFVREVIVADLGSSDQTLEIAEDAGAKVASGPSAFRDACRRARQPWLLLLPVDVRLDGGWDVEAQAHAERFADRPARLAPPGLAGLVPGRAGGRVLLIPKRVYEGLAPEQAASHAALARRMRHARRLSARQWAER